MHCRVHWKALQTGNSYFTNVKSGRRICGTGGCLANAPLHQNKSYFEFKIQSTGVWGIGVATQKVNLNQIPFGRDVHSLVLRHDGSVYHNNEEKNRLPANSIPQEGDIVVSHSAAQCHSQDQRLALWIFVMCKHL
ncbi:UNVERIFIED_CONTAM: hypothetical protein FKN15_074904 [Acipenser sinensis]